MRLHRTSRLLLLGALASLGSFGCAATGAQVTEPQAAPSATVRVAPEEGTASYYAHRFHGRRTAYGEIYDEHALTAAHPSLPHGTKVRVTNLENGKWVVLRVNDRGPWSKKRVIDVSYAAAKRLGFVREGLAEVRVDVVASRGAEDGDEEWVEEEEWLEGEDDLDVPVDADPADDLDLGEVEE